MKKLTATILLILINSCYITKFVNRDLSYQEKFTNFYATQDRKEIIFIGQKYDYAFDDRDELIKKLVNLKNTTPLTIENISLTAKESEVFGSVYIRSVDKSRDIKKKITKNLMKLGFEKRRDGFYYKKIMLSGVRYHADPALKHQDKNSSFKRSYRTKIKVEISNNRKKFRAAITPFSFAADGALWLSVPLVPILIFTTSDSKFR